MTSTSPQNILFDDFTLLEQQLGRQRLMPTSANANCDCIGYSTSDDDEDVRTDQIATAVNQAH